MIYTARVSSLLHDLLRCKMSKDRLSQQQQNNNRLSQKSRNLFERSASKGVEPQGERSQSGHRVVTEWSQSGHRAVTVVTEWSQNGHRAVTEWSQSGHRVVTERSQSVHRVVTEWSQSGHRVVTERSQSGTRAGEGSDCSMAARRRMLTIIIFEGLCLTRALIPLTEPIELLVLMLVSRRNAPKELLLLFLPQFLEHATCLLVALMLRGHYLNATCLFTPVASQTPAGVASQACSVNPRKRTSRPVLFI